MRNASSATATPPLFLQKAVIMRVAGQTLLLSRTEVVDVDLITLERGAPAARVDVVVLQRPPVAGADKGVAQVPEVVEVLVLVVGPEHEVRGRGADNLRLGDVVKGFADFFRIQEPHRRLRSVQVV